MKLIKHHWELDVYKLAMEMSRDVFQLSKSFLREEAYSLTDQIRRASRSVSAQVAEAWRRRKYEAVFVNKLNEAEGETAETQTWLEHAVQCGYAPVVKAREIHRLCDRILGKLVTMGNDPEAWVLKKSRAFLPLTH
jgi:four helix bundle protein